MAAGHRPWKQFQVIVMGKILSYLIFEFHYVNKNTFRYDHGGVYLSNKKENPDQLSSVFNSKPSVPESNW